MKTIYNRSTIKQRLETISDIPIAKFQARLKTSRRYRIFPSSNGIGQVERTLKAAENGLLICQKIIAIVRISISTNHLVLTVFAAARFSDIDPITLFDNHYSTRVYQKTYSKALIPISIENLVSDQSIKPPIIQKQAGRPKTKRVRKGDWQSKQTRCGKCLDWGHNRRRCTS